MMELRGITRGPWRVLGPNDAPNPHMGLWRVEAWSNVANHCTRADAHLIASAPDLYAVAARALAFVNALPVPTDGATALGIALNAALRNAEGEVGAEAPSQSPDRLLGKAGTQLATQARGRPHSTLKAPK